MSRPMRVLRRGERTVDVGFQYGPEGIVWAVLRCPECGQELREAFEGKETVFSCGCGIHLLLTLDPTLEAVEVEDGKGE